MCNSLIGGLDGDAVSKTEGVTQEKVSISVAASPGVYDIGKEAAVNLEEHCRNVSIYANNIHEIVGFGKQV